MIKPVTFQGLFNFKANLYALEIKSRFIDQTKASGFYKGYGNELNATIIDNKIQVGTGAFVVQGRMSEIVNAETVNVNIENGKVGYVCLRIETYHPADEENCSLIVKTGATLEAISLTQEDTYQAGAETSNKIYEFPIYSFAMANGNITNLVKLINPVMDYATVKALVDKATETAQSALQKASAAQTTAATALENSNKAKSEASTALTKSTTAESNASTALTNANEALRISKEKQGTVVSVNGVAQTSFNADSKVNVAQGAGNKNKILGTNANGGVQSQDYIFIGGDIKLSKEKNTTTGEVSLVIEFPEEA